MKVEILYPEIACLYGELFNMEYLRRSVPECGIASTSLGEKPRFLKDNSIDLVYMGNMTERSQLMVVNELTQYKSDIWNAIERGQRFLITGNALEIFGNRIEEKGEMVISEIGGEGYDCLGIFDFHVERDMLDRKNSLFVGDYYLSENDAIEIVGFRNQFGYGYYGDSAPAPLFYADKGMGFNPEEQREGLHYKNFMATYTMGPLLVLNPAFLVRLCWEMGYTGIHPAHMDVAMDSYRNRLFEYGETEKSFGN